MTAKDERDDDTLAVLILEIRYFRPHPGYRTSKGMTAKFEAEVLERLDKLIEVAEQIAEKLEESQRAPECQGERWETNRRVDCGYRFETGETTCPVCGEHRRKR